MRSMILSLFLLCVLAPLVAASDCKMYNTSNCYKYSNLCRWSPIDNECLAKCTSLDSATCGTRSDCMTYTTTNNQRQCETNCSSITDGAGCSVTAECKWNDLTKTCSVDCSSLSRYQCTTYPGCHVDSGCKKNCSAFSSAPLQCADDGCRWGIPSLPEYAHTAPVAANLTCYRKCADYHYSWDCNDAPHCAYNSVAGKCKPICSSLDTFALCTVGSSDNCIWTNNSCVEECRGSPDASGVCSKSYCAPITSKTECDERCDVVGTTADICATFDHCQWSGSANSCKTACFYRNTTQCLSDDDSCIVAGDYCVPRSCASLTTLSTCDRSRSACAWDANSKQCVDAKCDMGTETIAYKSPFPVNVSTLCSTFGSSCHRAQPRSREPSCYFNCSEMQLTGATATENSHQCENVVSCFWSNEQGTCLNRCNSQMYMRLNIDMPSFCDANTRMANCTALQKDKSFCQISIGCLWADDSKGCVTDCLVSGFDRRGCELIDDGATCNWNLEADQCVQRPFAAADLSCYQITTASSCATSNQNCEWIGDSCVDTCRSKHACGLANDCEPKVSRLANSMRYDRTCFPKCSLYSKNPTGCHSLASDGCEFVDNVCRQRCDVDVAPNCEAYCPGVDADGYCALGATPSDPPTGSPAASPGDEDHHAMRRKKWYILGGIGIVVVLLAIIAYIFVVKNRKQPNRAVEAPSESEVPLN